MPSHPLLAGRYRLESQIAAGGIGEVWRAEDTLLAQPAAVKLLRPELAENAETRARFRAEARHASALSHPAIARVYDYRDPVPPHPAFLVMELVDGPSLAGVLAAGPLGPAETMDVVAQVASGLQAAHAAALVHRDIKPANLLIAADGQVKITDFGIAHVAGSVPVTSTGIVMGTPAYIAPERVSGASATPASDLYSLGVVAYECLAGTPPFTGKPLEVAVAHRDLPLPPFPHPVPAEVAQLVAELTAKDPAVRPASAREVATRASRLRGSMTGGVASAAASTPHSVPATVAGSAPATVADVPVPSPVPGPAPSPASASRRRGLGARRPQPAQRPQPARPPQPARHPRSTRPAQPSRQARRHRWIAAASAAASVAVLALLALMMVPRPGGSPVSSAPHHLAVAPSPSVTPSQSPTATASPPPNTVVVAAQSLIGQPLGLVRERLQFLGLTVRVLRHRSDRQTGTVLAVQPSGKVRPASIIVVTVAFMLAQNNDGHHHHHHHRDGDGGTFPSAGTVAAFAARPSGR